jgi:predicted nucleic acid-binding protein
VKGARTVVLDACVLVPMPLADTLLRLAAGPHLFRPKWSDQIMAEVSRTLQEKFGLSQEKVSYRETEIRRHFPEAWIDGYERLIPAMTNHPKDRHVLAAAAHARAESIVTYNIKDFPQFSLAPYSITAQGPSIFLENLYDSAPLQVMQTLESQAAAIGQTLKYLLSRLRISAPAFVETIQGDRRARQ